MVLNEGIYAGLCAEDYHNDPCIEPGLSSGLAVKILKYSVLHAMQSHPRFGNQRMKETRAMDIGSLWHALVEGSDNIVVLEYDNFRTKASKEERDEAKSNGKIPALRDQYHEAKRIVEKMSDQASELCDCEHEVSYIWKDSGIWCRARADGLNHDTREILDYKTTQGSARPEDWERSQLWREMKYIQAALYTRGIKILTGDDYKFKFIVQEVKEEPYAISKIDMDATAMAFAQDRLDFAIAKWRDAIQTGNFTGYNGHTATLPKYLDAEWEAMNYE